MAAVGFSQRGWAWSMSMAVRATEYYEYDLSVRIDDMDIIDVPALQQHIVQ